MVITAATMESAAYRRGGAAPRSPCCTALEVRVQRLRNHVMAGYGGTVEGPRVSGYTQGRRGGRVVECGGLENRYVGNPGVGGSNPPLSASRASQHACFAGFQCASGPYSAL